MNNPKPAEDFFQKYLPKFQRFDKWFELEESVLNAALTTIGQIDLASPEWYLIHTQEPHWLHVATGQIWVAWRPVLEHWKASRKVLQQEGPHDQGIMEQNDILPLSYLQTWFPLEKAPLATIENEVHEALIAGHVSKAYHRYLRNEYDTVQKHFDINVYSAKAPSIKTT